MPALALAPGTPAGDDGDGFFPPGTFAPFPPSSPGNNPPSSTTTTNTVNGVNYPPGAASSQMATMQQARTSMHALT